MTFVGGVHLAEASRFFSDWVDVIGLEFCVPLHPELWVEKTLQKALQLEFTAKLKLNFDGRHVYVVFDKSPDLLRLLVIGDPVCFDGPILDPVWLRLFGFKDQIDVVHDIVLRKPDPLLHFKVVSKRHEIDHFFIGVNVHIELKGTGTGGGRGSSMSGHRAVRLGDLLLELFLENVGLVWLV